MNNMSNKQTYNADNIKVLEGLEAVRKRPSMYIGNVDIEGLHHLVYEVVDNSIDEAMAGYCDSIQVVIHTDNSVSVEDNGRGIPIGIHKKENIPALEVVMTKLHAGGKFDSDSYKVSGGLHGVGVSVVNALSSFLEVHVYTKGKIYYQTYKKGIKASELDIIGNTDKHGTKIHFETDTSIMTTNQFVFDVLSRRLRELAFLNKGITIKIEDERSDEKKTFFYEGGIVSFVEYLNRKRTISHKPIFLHGEKNDVQVEVAMQYNDSYTEKIFSFANNINTVEGGFHLAGFKGGLTRTVNNYAANADNLPKNLKEKISGDDIREGLTCVISVRLKSPQFEGQTKTKLGNSEVKGIVEGIINEKLAIFLEENPAAAKGIMSKAVDAARARAAARRARDLSRSKNTLGDTSLPGKLAECQSLDPKEREIFIVEGESAGGCFHGDTKLTLVDGRNLSFIELIEEEKQGRQNFCYTIMNDGSIGIEKILNPRKTKTHTKVIKITLDNDQEVICTPDHLFMLRDGTYKQAEELKKSDSIMPLVRKLSEKKHRINENYKQVITVKNYNHKIKSIELLDEKIDVYDIEVPNTHNFALASGVFVHNSAKQGRDRKFQAILPLKGKILNVEKARFDKMLKSEEIRNIITVLGTGVGGTGVEREDYNINNLKYHKVVIMVDADVDGSHIRTLLLTFFYRRMPEIIKHGYLYIAQPPLYRVGKGKNATYLKGEMAYNEYLMKRICEQKNVKLNKDDIVLSGHDLYLFLGNLVEYYNAMSNIKRQAIPSDLVELLIRNNVDSKEFLQDKSKMNDLKKVLIDNGYDPEEPLWNEERNVYEIIVNPQKDEDKAEEVFSSLYKKPIKIGKGLIFSKDFQTISVINKQITEKDYPPFTVFSNKTEKETLIDNKEELHSFLLEDAKKGLQIQRYKGLGEMNPDQLWETTMNPDKRILLKVKVEDGVGADDIFTLLMGDEVEPRRDFIQTNALEVQRLDI
ncbi:DNA gyrase subunit B [Candidatus Magnetomoraceae bacterium gMMP-15]